MQDVSSTKYQKDIRWLYRSEFIKTASLLILGAGGVFCIILYTEPARTFLPTEQYHLYQEKLPFLLAGITFILVAICGVIYQLLRKPSSQVLWVFKNITGKQMWLTIEADSYGGDGTSYYACLTKNETDEKFFWKPVINGPYWTIKDLLSKQVKNVPGKQQLSVIVYVDPKTGKPAVIETEIGLLWLNF